MALTADEVIDWFARVFDLPVEDPSLTDKAIEYLASNVRWKREDLSVLANAKPYGGASLDTLLILHDIMDRDSQIGLTYGIRAFETFGRDSKKIIGLENPDRLAQYVADSAADTAEGLEELVQFKNTIIKAGQFGDAGYGGIDNDTKRLANPLLIVATEIAFRLKDIDPRNLTEAEIDSMGFEEYMSRLKPWNMRLEAHGAIVMAYEAKGENRVNQEALDALAAYESLSGKYQIVSLYASFSMALMEEYAKRKYVADKLSTGKVPEELKGDPNKFRNYGDGGPQDWDQFFRAQFFGVKEREWEKRQRQRAQEARSGRFQAEQPHRSFRDPWSDYSEELQLLGLTKNMPYEEARAAFRRRIKEQRSAFTLEIIGTPEYESATKNAARILDAWSKVQQLYLQNQKP